MNYTREYKPKTQVTSIHIELTDQDLEDLCPSPMDLYVIEVLEKSNLMSDKLMSLSHLALLLERKKENETSNDSQVKRTTESRSVSKSY